MFHFIKIIVTIKTFIIVIYYWMFSFFDSSAQSQICSSEEIPVWRYHNFLKTYYKTKAFNEWPVTKIMLQHLSGIYGVTHCSASTPDLTPKVAPSLKQASSKSWGRLGGMTLTPTFLTKPSLVEKAFIVYSCPLACLSLSNTISSSLIFGYLAWRFCLLWSVLKYSLHHLAQNVSASSCTLFHWCLRMLASEHSSDRRTNVFHKQHSRGEEPAYLCTCWDWNQWSAIDYGCNLSHKCTQHFMSEFSFPSFKQHGVKIHCAIPTIHSQLSPMLESWGGLKTLCKHVHFWLRNLIYVKGGSYHRRSGGLSDIWVCHTAPTAS